MREGANARARTCVCVCVLEGPESSGWSGTGSAEEWGLHKGVFSACSIKRHGEGILKEHIVLQGALKSVRTRWVWEA